MIKLNSTAHEVKDFITSLYPALNEMGYKTNPYLRVVLAEDITYPTKGSSYWDDSPEDCAIIINMGLYRAYAKTSPQLMDAVERQLKEAVLHELAHQIIDGNNIKCEPHGNEFHRLLSTLMKMNGVCNVNR